MHKMIKNYTPEFRIQINEFYYINQCITVLHILYRSVNNLLY
jgi:hypothetical protein